MLKCTSDDAAIIVEPPNDCNYEFVDSIGLKNLHDILCQELCDSISSWRLQGQSDKEMISLTFNDLMIDRLSQLSNLEYTIIETNYQLLGISIDNLISWGGEMETMFSPEQNAIFTRIKDMYEVTFDDAEIISQLEIIKAEFECKLDPVFVNSVIEVGKSSLVYWNNHSSCVYSQGLEPRADPCRVRIAFADLWGAGYGAVGGGLVGAMFGAIGGTLGAGVGAAITGGCP